MKIQTTLDKIVIDADELQTLIKDYIKEKAGREVDGFVKFQIKNHLTNRDGTTSATAQCELTPATKY